MKIFVIIGCNFVMILDFLASFHMENPKSVIFHFVKLDFWISIKKHAKKSTFPMNYGFFRMFYLFSAKPAFYFIYMMHYWIFPL